MSSPWNGASRESVKGDRAAHVSKSSPPDQPAGEKSTPRQGRAATAWQPLTPRGVAAFAGSSWGRLIAIQLLMASVVAASVLWFFLAAWCPVIEAAIRALPEKGEIRAGRLQWQGDTATNLAESRFLAITVDPDHRGEARSPAHMQLEFGRFNCRVLSLFGFAEVDYPRHYSLLFNRTELVPWWGAWRPAVLTAVAFAVVAGLLAGWFLLTALYSLPAWLVALYANRRLSLFGASRLAGAALMPGALFMAVTIIVYGRGFLSFLDLSVAYAAHFLVGWVYLVLSILCLPHAPAAASVSVNPFQPSTVGDNAAQEAPGASLGEGSHQRLD